jgi:hypothetical protein
MRLSIIGLRQGFRFGTFGGQQQSERLLVVGGCAPAEVRVSGDATGSGLTPVKPGSLGAGLGDDRGAVRVLVVGAGCELAIGNGFGLGPERGATPRLGNAVGEPTKLLVKDTGDGIEMGEPKVPVLVWGTLAPLPVRGARAGVGEGGVGVGLAVGARRSP